MCACLRPGGLANGVGNLRLTLVHLLSAPLGFMGTMLLLPIKWAEGPCDFAKRSHIHWSYCMIGELVQGREDGTGKTFEIWMVPADLQQADICLQRV